MKEKTLPELHDEWAEIHIEFFKNECRERIQSSFKNHLKDNYRYKMMKESLKKFGVEFENRPRCFKIDEQPTKNKM